jgi:limonene-1,2-epoxide hydrolase
MSNDLYQEYVAALIERDWPRLSATLAPDVHREGFDGPRDSTDGLDDYIAYLARVMDPIENFGYDVHRIVATDDGKVGLVEVTSRYREGGEDLGYRMAFVLDTNADGLIDNVEIYWKTPDRRLKQDTVYDRSEA